MDHPLQHPQEQRLQQLLLPVVSRVLVLPIKQALLLHRRQHAQKVQPSNPWVHVGWGSGPVDCVRRKEEEVLRRGHLPNWEKKGKGEDDHDRVWK